MGEVTSIISSNSSSSYSLCSVFDSSPESLSSELSDSESSLSSESTSDTTILLSVFASDAAKSRVITSRSAKRLFGGSTSTTFTSGTDFVFISKFVTGTFTGSSFSVLTAKPNIPLNVLISLTTAVSNPYMDSLFFSATLILFLK